LNRNGDRRFIRLALVGAAIASLGLSACGRKGPLDLPPGGSYASEPRANVSSGPAVTASPVGDQTKDDNSGVGPNGLPRTPKGENKRIPLDVLLN
jgi:predicted small lipoprotein YifL